MVMAASTDPRVYRAFGGAAKLFACRAPEILYDGPRGNGKSRAAAEYIVAYMKRYQGCRILILRKTRASLSQTFLVTFEQVLALRHPRALVGPERSHRSSYRVGKSEAVVSGCDLESRQRSGEYSLIFVEECNELFENDWESVQGSLRWAPGGGPHQIIGCCNPDGPSHWLWKRHLRSLNKQDPLHGQFQRIQGLHSDNPSLPPSYLARLSRLTGVRRKRMYEGLWVAAEGQVMDNFDEAIHWIEPPKKTLKDGTEVVDYDALSISWYFGAMDWGTTRAGCLGVWGVDLGGRLYEVAEVYFKKRGIEWWKDVAVEMNRQFPMRAIVCDPSRPDMIASFNTALGYDPEAIDAIAMGANNKRASSPGGDLAGIDLMAEMLNPSPVDKKPRLYFLRDNTPYGIDRDLREEGRPCSTVEEVSSWVWKKMPDGRLQKDQTEDNCDDHGWDQTRYACTFARGKDLGDLPRRPVDEPGTMGALTQHQELIDEIEAEIAA